MDSSVVKDLLEATTIYLKGLNVVEPVVEDPGCDCCGVEVKLEKLGEVDDCKYIEDGYVKATDIREVVEALTEVMGKIVKKEM